MTSRSTVLELIEVNKTVTTNKLPLTILDKINFIASEGEINIIMGPSGSGKTTLLNLIGLIDIPSGGKIYSHGNLTNDLKETERTKLRAKKIGIIFQNFNLLPHLSALENIELPLLINKNINKTTREKKSYELLDLIGLTDRANNLPNTLSGGEIQRIAIARSLVANPSLLLADEPTGNVDQENEAYILDIFKKLRSSGVCLVIITHNSKYKDYADNIYTLVNKELKKELKYFA